MYFTHDVAPSCADCKLWLGTSLHEMVARESQGRLFAGFQHHNPSEHMVFWIWLRGVVAGVSCGSQESIYIVVHDPLELFQV